MQHTKSREVKKKYKEVGINEIKGYDIDGNLTMYYWQNKPFETREAPFYKLPRKLWWNPFWRIKQWWLLRRPTRIIGEPWGNDEKTSKRNVL